MQAVRVAIVGASGYTSLEMVKWLLRHPQARITYLASRKQETAITTLFPELEGRIQLAIRPFDAADIAKEADVAFLCLPHVASMEHAPALLAAGVRVVDLSADYRLANADTYRAWYKHEHLDPGNLKDAVYGLPEFFGAKLRNARFVANPGCYPTAAALGIVPLIRAGLASGEDIIINAASGITGAGRSPKQEQHFPERNEAFEPYAIGSHRHTPEIEQTLSTVLGEKLSVLFVPHLLPIDRGILETIYLKPAVPGITEAAAIEALRAAYAEHKFVRVRTEQLPSTKYVANSNFCDLAVRVTASRIVVISAIDNMVKGAAGQAIQNMNLMFGFSESAGLL